MSDVIEALLSGAVSGIFTAFSYRLLADHVSTIKTEWMYKHSLAIDVISTLRSTIQVLSALRKDSNKVSVNAKGVAARKDLAKLFSSQTIASPVLKPESIVEKIRDANFRRWIMLYYNAVDTLRATSLASEMAYNDLIKTDEDEAMKNIPLETHRSETFNSMQDHMLTHAFMSTVYGVRLVREILRCSMGYDYFMSEKYELARSFSERYGLTAEHLDKLDESLGQFDGKPISVEEARAFPPIVLGRSGR